MPAQKYRPRVEVEALQWLGDLWSQNGDDMLEFTDERGKTSSGLDIVRTLFMALDGDDAEETLGEAECIERQKAGYTAVVYSDDDGRWHDVGTGDWIIKGVHGAFFVCAADDFASSYELVEQ